MDPKLYKAAADGNIDALQQFNDIPNQVTPKGNTVLHIAAHFGQAKLVEKILQSPSLSPSLRQPNEKGDTPLHLAAREGHLTAVKNLIAAAKLLQRDTEGEGTTVCEAMLRMSNEEEDTALHEAVTYNHSEVVKLLIKEDPQFSYGANSEGNTPLYIAADRGFRDLVQVILDKFSSPAHTGIKGRTALHAAVILNDLVITRKILKWKPDLSKELDENGWSPLHFAAYVGCHPTIVRELLEKSERYVVYLGVLYDEIGNRTALHIASSRGHVEVVKVLVSHFPDCCEKVDDLGNNVLHLFMSDEETFQTFSLLGIRLLWVRGLMNEKNVEGKTPLQLFYTSSAKYKDNFIPLKSLYTTISEDVKRWRLRRSTLGSVVSMRSSSSLEIKKDSGSSIESEKIISEMKKTMKNHMIVAALIATVTFAAGITLPGGYVQSGSNNQGMAVLSTLPTNGTDGYMAAAARANFERFVRVDTTAMLLSMSAMVIYFIASFPIKDMKTVGTYLLLGNILTMLAMLTMLVAFLYGLRSVLSPSSLLSWITIITVYASILMFLTLTPVPRWTLSRKQDKSYYQSNFKLTNYIIHFLAFGGLFFLLFVFVGL